MNNFDKTKIAIIGLGYVGMPLLIEFGKHFETIGFDINEERILELRSGEDSTLEISKDDLQRAISSSNNEKGVFFTGNIEDIREANFYIVAVPTPTDKNNRPDLSPLCKASELVGSVLKKNDVVVYESTVYPGVIEDFCVPVLEKKSKLKYNEDFFVGYSPERINPGDKENTLSKIVKITSGSTPDVADYVDEIYRKIIVVGTHKASSIKVAEAAKVIENSQRDINIAFMNELSKIFSKLGIDTNEVLEAAGTKWNFLKFKPGLVGGHCIGVDPYYLAQKAQEVGYHPEIILAGRRINDGMGEWIASEIIKLMIQRDNIVKNSKILVLGITFKENCPDIRNTKVANLIKELQEYGCQVDVYDPWASKEEVLKEYGINLLSSCDGKYEAIILAVAHKDFADLDVISLKSSEKSVVYDVKGILDRGIVSGRL